MTVSIVIYVLAAVYAMAGVTKLAGVKMMKANFENFGYPQWFRLLIGAAEIGGAALLLFSATVPLAAIGLVVIMIGAFVSHLRIKEFPQSIPTVVLGVLLVWVGIDRWAEFAALFEATPAA